MKAAELTSRPKFRLLKQSDVVSYFHMQMPRWLFCHSRYKALPLEAKVAYTFLLNRFQLSRMNGWVNGENEVFVIYTRESLAQEMQISYRKAIECFKELSCAGLIWEKRVGRGDANQIYLARVELSEEDARQTQSAPFSNGREDSSPAPDAGDTDAAGDETRPAYSAYLPNCEAGYGAEETAESMVSDLPKPHVWSLRSGTSEPADSAFPDLPKPHTNQKDTSDIELIQNDGSQSDARDLRTLLASCGVEYLPGEVSGVFRNAIERLWYARQFCVDGSILPQDKIRADLLRLHSGILDDVYHKLKRNTDTPVRNSTAYIMAAILNNIWEYDSDPLVDPELNRMAATPFFPALEKEGKDDPD